MAYDQKGQNDDWFDPPSIKHFYQNPLDSMPIATDKGEPIDTAPSECQPPGVDEEITIHEKMYRLATQNGSTIGGSEHCHDDHS